MLDAGNSRYMMLHGGGRRQKGTLRLSDTTGSLLPRKKQENCPRKRTGIACADIMRELMREFWEEVVTDYIYRRLCPHRWELAAMVVVMRWPDWCLGTNDESAETESFHNDLLEYPQYSRPEEWHGKKVPEVISVGQS